ncbi:GNAT family N-acetyltransferase [Nocardioides cynanchi]|uniref:GNAT family N-acetyltransferase n=1 Tax=Nocardioides cynanchi TaxID=2558918 RepID=UPI001248D5EB|nr:GNAT family N-acetyltransferase [Nocardioides cynanchi]
MPLTRLAGSDDLEFLVRHDGHVSSAELEAVVGRDRVLLMVEESAPEPLGWLRWGLFWDTVPFMNMLQVVPTRRGQGLGRLLVESWEHRCLGAGQAWVLTSTMSDERAQHFYRHLGYRDVGAFELPGEAPELLLRKDLA